MKLINTVISLLLITLISLPVSAEKRKARKSQKELTDPLSPSYVPYPYSKKRAEIIANLKYALGRKSKGSKFSFVDGVIPEILKIRQNLLEEQPDYDIGEIIPIKNRVEVFPDDYMWLILIMGKDGQVAARIVLDAAGLMLGSAATTEKVFLKVKPESRARLRAMRPYKKEKDVIARVKSSLDISREDIKEMEQVVLMGGPCTIIFPLWEIILTNGKTYIYSTKRDVLYRVVKNVPWYKTERGLREDWRPLVAPYKEFLFDTLNDQVVLLERIDRKLKSKYNHR